MTASAAASSAKKSVTKIAVLGGDGTGPEVAREGLKVLKAVAGLTGFKYELTDFDFGGDRYLKTGEVLPAGAVDELPSTLCSSDPMTWPPRCADPTGRRRPPSTWMPP